MGFEELVKKLSPTLKRITYKLNGHFTFFSDEDLFQEALIHLLGDFKDGKLQDKTDSYILQGCYFYLKNHIRKVSDKARIVSLSSLLNEEGGDLEDILPAAPIRGFGAGGSEDMLLKDVEHSGLDERERKLVDLCMEGLTVREIGAKLGISHVMVIKLRNEIRIKCSRLKAELLK